MVRKIGLALIAALIATAAPRSGAVAASAGISRLIAVTTLKAQNANDEAVRKGKAERSARKGPRDIATGQASGKRMHKAI